MRDDQEQAAALDKPARRWAYDDPVTGQTCYSDTPLTCAGAYEVPVDSPADPRREAMETLIEDCREFVRKCERGEARSRHSYGAMKDHLAALDKPVREEEPVMPGVNTEVPDVADD